jgi:hypothetical protein
MSYESHEPSEMIKWFLIANYKCIARYLLEYSIDDDQVAL